MEPLNKPARRKAQRTFGLLFLLTLVAVGAAVYSSYWVPIMQNQRLRGQVKQFKATADFRDSVFQKLSEIKADIDSSNFKGSGFTGQYPVIVTRKLTQLGNALGDAGILEADKRHLEDAIVIFTLYAEDEAKLAKLNSKGGGAEADWHARYEAEKARADKLEERLEEYKSRNAPGITQ